jgi:predicted ATPase
LYGREEDLALLRAALTRSRNVTMGSVLIAGYSGIGKTALVERLQQDVIDYDGHLFAGKFEQYKRTAPYSAISQVVEALSTYILSLPEAQFQAWQSRLQGAVSPVGRVLSDVFPSLAPILGAQAAVQPLVGTAAQNRFNHVFGRLLEALAGTERPMVLFIDDLQWIDSSSLSLLAELISSPAHRGLLILGAYRDNEVDPSHPLSVVLSDAQQNGAELQTIRLKNLLPQHVHELLADTLSPLAPSADLGRLTELLHKKSGGNPFHLRRLLTELFDRGQIRFTAERHGWTWDLEALHGLELTENVVEFMLHQLGRLPMEVQRFLVMAACIGDTIRAPLLREALDIDERPFQQALAVALSEELLVMGPGGWPPLRARSHPAGGLHAVR